MSSQALPSWNCFLHYQQQGFKLIAGLDEVGRGSIAGPVVVAAVLFQEVCSLPGVNDSKRLSPAKRLSLANLIKSQALAYSFGLAEPYEIDQHNILNATRMAAERCIKSLSIMPDLVLCDGNQKLVYNVPSQEIIEGDANCLPIACASIIAKVYRDELMTKLSLQYPEYRLDRNKGYGTSLHFEAIAQYGITAIHRKTFINGRKNNSLNLF